MQRLFTFIVVSLLLILALSLLAVDYAGKNGTRANHNRNEIRETDATLTDRSARLLADGPAENMVGLPAPNSHDQGAGQLTNNRPAKPTDAAPVVPSVGNVDKPTGTTDNDNERTRQKSDEVQGPPGPRLQHTAESRPNAETANDPGLTPSGVLPRMPPPDSHLDRSKLAFRVQVATRPRDLAGLDPEQKIGQLTITGDRFSSGSLKHLKGMSILAINIEAVNISNTGLIYLAKVADLRELRLWAPGVNDDGLTAIAQLSDLVLLDLEGTSVQGTGLVHLNALERLAKLTLGPNMRDQEIGLLRTFSQLDDLDLRSCRRLTDACADQIGQIHGLRVVWLPAQLSAAAKKAIGESLPNCRLEL